MKIMIVDDSKTDVMLISKMLRGYELIEAHDGDEALDCLKKDKEIDIVLLDLNMPRLNGFEVLKTVKWSPGYRDISVIILTNYDEIENEILGLQLGAVDYIRKPINIESLKVRIELHSRLIYTRKALERQNMQLEEKIRERTKECNAARDVTISAMVNLLEVRSIESSNHTRRTSWMMKLLCSYLRMKPRYENVLSDDYIQELVSTAPLHDIGKIGISDDILLKPGKLTSEEYEQMKMHTLYGVHALEYAKGKNPGPSFINTALQIVGTHHERYDGSGYPNGLKGEDIPLPGRLMSILDVYDAITSERVYKPAYSHEYAIEAIKEGRGTQFDPEITDAFIAIQDDVKNISEWFMRDIS